MKVPQCGLLIFNYLKAYFGSYLRVKYDLSSVVAEFFYFFKKVDRLAVNGDAQLRLKRLGKLNVCNATENFAACTCFSADFQGLTCDFICNGLAISKHLCLFSTLYFEYIL